MDGTPYITQCPILPGTRFVYKFKAQISGTMFYHSHVSFQRGDGHFGPYIVRQPVEEEANAHLYDFDLTEHVIFPQEWFHKVIGTQCVNLKILREIKYSTFLGAQKLQFLPFDYAP